MLSLRTMLYSVAVTLHYSKEGEIVDRARIVQVLILVALVVSCGPSIAATQDSSSQVELRWALGALDTNGETLNAVRKDSRLAAGTRLKFLVEPMSTGPVYLILLDSQDDIHLMYKGSAEDSLDRRYVPAGRQWLELDDNGGRETFFLLASVSPLDELDRLLADHASASDADARKEIGSAVVAEIRRLHAQHREFTRAVERPVMIGGRTRGEPSSQEEIDRIAVEVNAERFFGKTITIDH